METKDVDAIITEYLSYQDADLSPEDKKRCIDTNFGEKKSSATESAEALIQAFETHGEAAVEDVVDRLLEDANTVLSILGVEYSPNVSSRSWAYWDIGKQYHDFLHPKEADPNYSIADPIVDQGKFEEIADTMIGWELDNGSNKYELRDKLDKTSTLYVMLKERIHTIEQKGLEELHSYQFAAFGKEAREFVKLSS